MAFFYADENFPQPVVVALRNLGHDVLTAFEAGQANLALPDDKVLEYSTSNNRILLTMNRRHFIHLHQSTPEHSGIFVCNLDPDSNRQANNIHIACNRLESAASQLLRISRTE